MNVGGDAADQMVREGIQITESATKLAGLGAKNLAALLIALAQDGQKLQGKTNTKRLLKEGKELTIFQIKTVDLEKFRQEAEHYGVLFAAIVDKTRTDGCCDLMAKAEDAVKINRIFERMNYPAPIIVQAQEKNAAKKGQAAPRDSKSPTRESGWRASIQATEANDSATRPSVRNRLEALRAAAQEPPATQPQPTRARSKTKPKEK